MLESGKIFTEVKLPGRTKDGRPVEILLAILCIFSNYEKDEVSFSEFLESIVEFQKKFSSLGYSFSERFLISIELFSDLEDLKYRGYIRDYHYRVDALLPKRFLALTTLGKGQGKRILRLLPDDVVKPLENAVKTAMRNYEERWRLWAR